MTNAVCTVNPRAAEQAARLDGQKADQGARGALHGQAVLVKDNIDTADLLTTAGSLALSNAPPAGDAPLVRRLRRAGLVVLGKTNLSEWANIRDERSTSGWSGYGGLTRNPYALNRSAGGSSSGSGAAVAARLARFAVGTETDGSITCPAAYNGCVGIKPTVGLISTEGVVPISSSQDTPGPLALTVKDAAALLSVLTDDGTDYASHAIEGRLAGKRIGVPRKHFWGGSPQADAAAEESIGLLSAAGALIVDNTDIDAMVDYGFDDELAVMLAELVSGMRGYLASRPGDGPKTLADLVAFNREHAEEEMAYFGQSFFEMALELPAVGSVDYAKARAACLAHGRDDGIDKVLREHSLDALISPPYGPAGPIDLVNEEHNWGTTTQPAAMAGYPLVTVPSGLVHGLPVAVSFWGTAGSEATLIEIACGYELERNRVGGELPEPTYPSFI